MSGGDDFKEKFNVMKQKLLEYVATGQEMNFYRELSKYEKFSISPKVSPTIPLFFIDKVKYEFVFKVYCFRNIIVDTTLPNYKDDPDYKTWLKIMELYGVEIPEVYEINDPLPILVWLTFSQPTNGSVNASIRLFAPISIIYDANTVYKINDLFTKTFQYMNRTYININLIRKLLKTDIDSSIWALFHQNSELLTEELKQIIFDNVWYLYNRNELKAIIVVQFWFSVLRANEQDNPENELIKQFIEQMPIEAIFYVILTNRVDINVFITYIEKYHPDVNMQIPISMLPDSTNTWHDFGNKPYITMLTKALSHGLVTIAVYLINHGAHISDYDVIITLRNPSQMTEVLKELLVRGIQLPPEEILNKITDRNSQARTLIRNWPKLLATYALAKTNPEILANGLEDFNDFLS